MQIVKCFPIPIVLSTVSGASLPFSVFWRINGDIEPWLWWREHVNSLRHAQRVAQCCVFSDRLLPHVRLWACVVTATSTPRVVLLRWTAIYLLSPSFPSQGLMLHPGRFVHFFWELLHHAKSKVTSDPGVQGYSSSREASVLLSATWTGDSADWVRTRAGRDRPCHKRGELLMENSHMTSKLPSLQMVFHYLSKNCHLPKETFLLVCVEVVLDSP